MGDDAERAEEEYWANWAWYNNREQARILEEQAQREEDWSEGGLVQRFPDGLTPEQISERIADSLRSNPIPGLTYWGLTPEQRAGLMSTKLVAHRTSTNATWNLGHSTPLEGREMFTGDQDFYGPQEVRREREGIAEDYAARMVQWRRGQLAARLRHLLEGNEVDTEPEATSEELELIAEYATSRLAELKRLAQRPTEPDVSTDGPCVVTFSRSYNSGRTNYTYAALRIPTGPNAGMWTATGHRVRNFLTWDELMEFAAGPDKNRPVIVQVVSGWNLL